MPLSSAARTRFQLHAFKALRMRSRSSLRCCDRVSFLEGVAGVRLDGAGFWDDAGFWDTGGAAAMLGLVDLIGRSKSSASTSLSSLSTQAFKSTFSSCRTLPGHGYDASRC